MSETREIEWTSDVIADPEGDYLWLATDAYPTEEAALAEAREGARITGRERMRLRPADENDEDDRYLIDEWGATTVAEPCDEGGREFWAIENFPPPSGSQA